MRVFEASLIENFKCRVYVKITRYAMSSKKIVEVLKLMLGHAEWCMALVVYCIILGIMTNVFLLTGFEVGLFYLIPLFTGFLTFIEMIHVQWIKITIIYEAL